MNRFSNQLFVLRCQKKCCFLLILTMLQSNSFEAHDQDYRCISGTKVTRINELTLQIAVFSCFTKCRIHYNIGVWSCWSVYVPKSCKKKSTLFFFFLVTALYSKCLVRWVSLQVIQINPLSQGEWLTVQQVIRVTLSFT